MRRIAAVLSLASVCVLAAAAIEKTGYHVVNEIKIGGEGGWDYLNIDTVAKRLYVSHGTKVDVVDLKSGSVIGQIPNTPRVHGIAIANELGRGFVSSGEDNTVTIFDLGSLNVISRVKVTGEKPDAILYEPATKRVFAMNGHTNNTTVLDAATGNVVNTLALGGAPEFAVADGAGKVFVNLEDKGQVVPIDAKAMTVGKPWQLATCEEPSGLAIDRAHARLFSVCSNRMMVVSDASAGKALTTLPIGAGPDAAAFDPATQLAFSSNGEGSLTVVHEDAPDKFTVVDSVPTRRGARTMALDYTTHRLYLSTAQFGPAPAPTEQEPRPRPSILPGTFTVLVVDR